MRQAHRRAQNSANWNLSTRQKARPGLFSVGCSRWPEMFKSTSAIGTTPQRKGTMSESRDLAHDSRHILLGERGIGKTTFVNYLISVLSKEADECETIIVRLDGAGAPAEMKIQDCLKFKICKILFAYYDTSNPLRPTAEHRKPLFDLSFNNVRLIERFRLNKYHASPQEFEDLQGAHTRLYHASSST